MENALLARDRSRKARDSECNLSSYQVVKSNFAEGGEAFIDLVADTRGNKLILKRFRSPNDPVFATNEHKLSAKLKLLELPEKLPAFPKLPNRVVAPRSIVLNPDKSVLGYLMDYIDNSFSLSDLMSRDGRLKHGLNLNQITEIFLDLYDTILKLHCKGVVIGDLKPENILIRNLKAYIIDSESMQFGKFKCHAYSEEWIDPSLCKKENDSLVKVKDVDTKSDWFAFASMFYNALTGISPYAGTAFNENGLISETTRRINGISTFTKGVKIPSFALKSELINEDLIKYFKLIFSNSGTRGRPNRKLLESLVWTNCSSSKNEFSSKKCSCGNCQSPDTPTSKIEISPTVKVADFPIKGRILATSVSANYKFHYLQHSFDGNKVFRNRSKCIGQLADAAIYESYMISDSTICMLAGDTLFIKQANKFHQIKVTGKAHNQLPRVSLSGSSIIVIGSHGASYVDFSTGKNNFELKKSSQIKGVWLTSDDSGIGLEISDDNRISLKKIRNDAFEKIKNFPELCGDVVCAKLYKSRNVSWFVVRIDDRDELSDFIFCFDNSFTLKAFCKTENLLTDDYYDNALALEANGIEYLYSRSKTENNAFRLLGNKVLSVSINQIAAIDHSSIAHSLNGELLVFNPIVEQ